MSETLHVELRSGRGTREARRQRSSGKVPAVLYGHGEQNVLLSVAVEQLRAVVRHGARVVDLTGAVSEKALIRELQLDTFGHEYLHLDLSRVSADERVTVEVAVDLRGEAKGVKDGGVLEVILHSVEIECPAISIPDRLYLKVNDLELGGHLSAGAIDLPAGTTLISDADAVVVNCVRPTEVEEPGAPTGESAEPELIGRKKEAEEEAAE